MTTTTTTTATIKLQEELETTYSKSVLKQEINKFVDNFINESVYFLNSEWNNYLDKLEELKEIVTESNTVKTSESTVNFHSELMKSCPFKGYQIVSRALKIAVYEELVSYNKRENLNALAYKIARKTVYKLYKKDVNLCLTFGLNIVTFLENLNIIQIQSSLNKENHRIYGTKLNIEIPQELQDLASQLRAGMPMLCKPLNHTEEQDGGYLLSPETVLSSYDAKNRPTGNSLVAINYLQSTKCRVITDDFSYLSDYKEHERFYDEKLNFQHKEYNKLMSDLDTFKDKDIYFPYAFDKRGRIYNKSTYLTTQGDKWQKAMIEFANKKTLSPMGIRRLKIAIANELYSDKCTYEEALQWFDANESNMETLVKESKHPIVYNQYKDLVKGLNGEAVGTIVHWDATNSGLQLYSVLGADEKAARLCNVIGNEIADAYGILANALNDVTKTDNFNRNTTKKAFMTFLYGCEKSMLLSEDIDDDRYTNLLEAFPEGTSQDEAWNMIQKAMETIAPSAIKLMQLIYLFRDGKSEYNWTMEDGFVCHPEVTETKEYKGWRLSLDGSTHQGSIKTKVLQASKFDKSLAPNVIHSLDAYVLRQVVLGCKDLGIELVTIHDSFGCHPNDSAQVIELYRKALVKVLEGDMLKDILSQLNETKATMADKKGMLVKGNLTKEDILNASYPLR